MNQTKDIIGKVEEGDVQGLISFFQGEKIEPFDVDYQNRFLNLFLTDKEGFPERIIDIMQVDFFDSYQKILLNYQLISIYNIIMIFLKIK